MTSLSLTPPAFPTSEALSIMRVEHGHVSYSVYQNISIAVWVGQATLPVLKTVQEVNKEMVARFPGGHSTAAFVLDGLPAPTPDAQVVLSRTFENRSQLAVTGIVLEGSGFWASGLRGMINNSHREANSKSLLKITTSVDQLVTWFSEEHEARTGVSILPMQLRDVLLQARPFGERAARGEP